MNITKLLTCDYCSKIYKDPVFLNCCGKHICKDDLNKKIETASLNAKCPLCEHEIQNQNFRINETLNIMINEFELHEFKLDPEYGAILKEFREKIQCFKNSCNYPEISIDKNFSELRRTFDLDNENAKLEIDKNAKNILNKLKMVFYVLDIHLHLV